MGHQKSLDSQTLFTSPPIPNPFTPIKGKRQNIAYLPDSGCSESFICLFLQADGSRFSEVSVSFLMNMGAEMEIVQ